MLRVACVLSLSRVGFCSQHLASGVCVCVWGVVRGGGLYANHCHIWLAPIKFWLDIRKVIGNFKDSQRWNTYATISYQIMCQGNMKANSKGGLLVDVVHLKYN